MYWICLAEMVVLSIWACALKRREIDKRQNRRKPIILGVEHLNKSIDY